MPQHHHSYTGVAEIWISAGLVDLHLTSPSSSSEEKTTRWIRARRILFHISHTASTKQTPPGYKPKGPNLYCQASRCRSPTHSRPGGRRRWRGSMFRPDGSTGSRSHPLSPLVGRGFERNHFVVWRCGGQNKLVAQTMISVKLLVWPCTKRCSPGPTLDQPLDQSIYHFSCLFGLLSDNKHYFAAN